MGRLPMLGRQELSAPRVHDAFLSFRRTGCALKEFGMVCRSNLAPLMYDGVNTVVFFIVDTCGYIMSCTISHLSYYSTSNLVCLVPGFRIHWLHFCRLEVASIVECMQRLSHGIAMWCTSSWTTGRHLKIWGTYYRSGVEWQDPCLCRVVSR